jgi:CheY-like chemotaxis protein
MDAHVPALRPTPEPGGGGSSPRTRSSGVLGRILVVDDEEFIGKTITYGLGCDYEVVAVTRAASALEILTAGARFDLILCDLLMPEMSGMELYRRIRARVPDQVPRIVFFTGAEFNPEVRDFLKEVPNLWIEKPFEFSALLALVRDRIRLPTPTPAPQPQPSSVGRR